ncbi:hypothetical protein ACU8KH_00691 [Lachancea thermotolerans]
MGTLFGQNGFGFRSFTVTSNASSLLWSRKYSRNCAIGKLKEEEGV